jgi:putative ubiquitin-RnfH superfamily antitoxin RatB of RatAB toxin-antitoxin module
MAEKKQTVFKSPDLQKMQAVVINHRTKIYIPLGADPEEAKKRYLSRLGFKKP